MIPASRQVKGLQSALYVVIVAVIATLVLDRLLTYAEAAEKATMEATVSRVNSALAARLAYLVLRGEHDAIESLRAESPFETVRARVPGYLGQFDGVPPDAEGGTWYFDRIQRELVYMPERTRHLRPAAGEAAPPPIRYRVEVRKLDGGVYAGAILRPVGSWNWDPGL